MEQEEKLKNLMEFEFDVEEERSPFEIIGAKDKEVGPVVERPAIEENKAGSVLAKGFEVVKKPEKLLAIKMKATMEKGIYEEVIGEDKDLITSIVSTYSKFKEHIKPTEAPGIDMASPEEPSEIYCEVSKQPNVATEVEVNWKLKNTK